MPAVLNPTGGNDREAFYQAISKDDIAPLWEVLHTSILLETPRTPCLPKLWRWAPIWNWIRQSGTLISAQEAERRVLILENPGLRGKYRATRTLFAGLQMILPGETAPAHRHSQSALRFVIHGTGAYTAIDGERVDMRPGDFIITPAWTWHDHGNLADEPVVWLDGLDVPIVEFLDAQFAEKYPQERQPAPRAQGENLARFGYTMKPVDYTPRSKTSPMFWYPYVRSREALETLRRSEAPHPCWGHKLQYTNPATGGWAIPTIGSFLQLLPRGFEGKDYRSTDSTVYVVVEGRGAIVIGGETRFEFGPKDIFVVPSWSPYRFDVADDCVLFSYSDRPVQQALDLWRETY